MKKNITFIVLILLTLPRVGSAQLNEINSPIENFDRLWNIFDNRYANFSLKGVNWKETRKKYSVLITAETMNKELFKVCCRMLQELNDGHVSIEPNFREDDIECGPPYQFIHDIEFGSDEEVQKLESLIANELEKQGFSTASKRKLSEGTNFQFRSSSSFGYLRLDEMTEKITFGKFRRAVDRSIKEFENKRGLIIDLRFNGGGWDYNAYALASRFVPKGKTIGHLERTRIKGTDEYTPMKYRTVKSRGKRQFTGPIVILTSDFTASAAEVFVLLMKELPNVTIIGDETEGIFSDMYEFKLPNKWKVSLSHQQYFSTDGENYEGRGIPPEVKIVNSKVDLVNQIDPVIRQAINHLEKENNP